MKGSALQPDSTAALRRVAVSSYVGSAIEFYDFFIYGTAAALVFPTVFFPHLSPVAATVASLGTFAAAFLSRPLGAAVFGNYGDRIGRKRVLVITLLMMGGATVAVGLLPTPAVIGAAAPLLLVVLRLVQGFAVGGEWAGSVLLSTEHAPPGRRGFYGMFTQLGFGTALVLANLVFLVVHLTIKTKSEAFFTWGWRLPFLLSVVLLAAAAVIRRRVEDDGPPSQSGPETGKGLPLADLIRHQWRQVLLAAAMVAGVLTLAYQVGTFVTHYASVRLQYSKDVVLFAGVLGGLAAVGCVAASAILSDTYGRRRLILLGSALAVPWALVLMPLIDTRRPVVLTAAIVVSYMIVGIALGPLASFIPDLFPARYRYTAAALSHNIGGIVGGGLPPVLSPGLLASHGPGAVGAMMAGLAAAGVGCLLLLPDGATTA